MKLHVDFIRSSNGKRDIACYVYVPDGEVRGIVQISHGMCDYIENYALLAERLTEKGIVVCGNDHLGHGNSAEDSRDYGYFGNGGYQTLLKDLRKMNKLVRTTYKNVPLVLLGHSMGSFLARAYAVTYPETIDGAVFLGTAGSHNPVRAAQMLAATICKTRGSHHRSRLLYDLAFKGYNAKYPHEGEFAWLSRDAAAGEKFAADPQRNFIFTADGYYGLFSVLAAVSKPTWAQVYPKELPTWIAAGEMDPVGNYGKGPAEVYEKLCAAGAEQVSLKLYADARHELHNEHNKEEFFSDLYKWIELNKLVK
ncbi:MAG: alpha/beta fold hydrolase [Clostridia bacterium]|nr:alpha/beta fold hydrolase [Clostridia bacterium]